MKATLLVLPILCGVMLFGAAGCGKDPSTTVDDKNAQALGDINAQAVKANGDFDKLSPTGKQQILGMTNGDEKQARTLLQHMAHPPNEGRVGAHAGANGPPGGNK